MGSNSTKSSDVVNDVDSLILLGVKLTLLLIMFTILILCTSCVFFFCGRDTACNTLCRTNLPRVAPLNIPETSPGLPTVLEQEGEDNNFTGMTAACNHFLKSQDSMENLTTQSEERTDNESVVKVDEKITYTNKPDDRLPINNSFEEIPLDNPAETALSTDSPCEHGRSEQNSLPLNIPFTQPVNTFHSNHLSAQWPHTDHVNHTAKNTTINSLNHSFHTEQNPLNNNTIELNLNIPLSRTPSRSTTPVSNLHTPSTISPSLQNPVTQFLLTNNSSQEYEDIPTYSRESSPSPPSIDNVLIPSCNYPSLHDLPLLFPLRHTSNLIFYQSVNVGPQDSDRAAIPEDTELFQSLQNGVPFYSVPTPIGECDCSDDDGEKQDHMKTQDEDGFPIV